MFGLSFGELIVICVVVLLVFGPDKLPHVASKLGKISGDLKRTSDSLRREFYNSVYTPADEISSLKRDVTSLISTGLVETPQNCPQEPTIKSTDSQQKETTNDRTETEDR